MKKVKPTDSIVKSKKITENVKPVMKQYKKNIVFSDIRLIKLTKKHIKISSPISNE